MAVVKAARNRLRQPLNLVLLGALGHCVLVEPGQHVLLVQPVEQLALARHLAQDLGHLVRNVGPARRQEVHLDHGVTAVAAKLVGALFVEGDWRQQAAAVLVRAATGSRGGSTREAAIVPRPLFRVV